MSMFTPKILVWDAPVRVFHVLLALSFAGAWATAEADGWRLVHLTLGYTVAGLVVLRLLWGLVGTRHARFVQFVRGPQAVWAYLQALLAGRAPRFVGHNPLGAVAIVALLLLGLVVPLSGWATLNEVGGEWFEEVHEALGNAMVIVVGAHIAGVLLASWLHRERLVAAMVTGYKSGQPSEAIARPWRPLAVLLLAAVLGFWFVQWRAAAEGGVIQPQRVQAVLQGESEED